MAPDSAWLTVNVSFHLGWMGGRSQRTSEEPPDLSVRREGAHAVGQLLG